MSKTTAIVVLVVLYLLWSRSRVVSATGTTSGVAGAGNSAIPSGGSGYVLSLPTTGPVWSLPILAGPGNSTVVASPIIDYGAS